MKKTKNYLMTFVAILMAIVTFITPVSALSWNGNTSSSGQSGASSSATGGYAIHSTWYSNPTLVLGLRFSLYNIYDEATKGKTIDVYREAYSSMASSRHKVSPKYNKIEWMENYKTASLSTSTSITNCIIDTDYGISLPQYTSGIEDWQKKEANLDEVLGAMGNGTVASLDAGDYILVEPLFPVTAENTKMNMTIAEIGAYGAAKFGENVVPTNTNATQGTWNYICDTTNRRYPNALYLESALVGRDGATLIPKGSVFSSTVSFKKLITSGNGVGIAYKSTANPNYTLTVNPNGGTWKYDSSGGTNYKSYTSSYSMTVKAGQSVDLQNVPTRTGYIFMGWEISNSTCIVGSDLTAYTHGYGNCTLTAKWGGGKIIIKYNSNYGNVDSDTYGLGSESADTTAPSQTADTSNYQNNFIYKQSGSEILRQTITGYSSNGLYNYSTFGLYKDNCTPLKDMNSTTEGALWKYTCPNYVYSSTTNSFSNKSTACYINENEGWSFVEFMNKVIVPYGGRTYTIQSVNLYDSSGNALSATTNLDNASKITVLLRRRNLDASAYGYSNYMSKWTLEKTTEKIDGVSTKIWVLTTRTEYYYKDNETYYRTKTYDKADVYDNRTNKETSTAPNNNVNSLQFYYTNSTDDGVLLSDTGVKKYGSYLVFNFYAQWVSDVRTVEFDENYNDRTTNLYTVSSTAADLVTVAPYTAKNAGTTVTVDNKTGSTTLNGTPTKNFTLGAATVPLNAGDKYRITLEYVSGSVTSTSTGAFVTDVSGISTTDRLTLGSYINLKFPTSTDKQLQYTFTIPEGIPEGSDILQFWVYAPSKTVTFSNYKFNWKVERITDDMDTYTMTTPSKLVSAGYPIGTLPTPTREGYVFLGWYTSAEGGSKITTSTIPNKQNVTYYAHWESDGSAFTDTIEHWASGFTESEGTNSDGDSYLLDTTTPFTLLEGDTFTLDESLFVNAPTGFTKRLDIATTYLDSDGKEVSYQIPQEFTQIANNMKFEYWYDPINYNIVYDLQGGVNSSNNPNTYNVLYGVTIEEPTKQGFMFKGWYAETMPTTYSMSSDSNEYKYSIIHRNLEPSVTYNIDIAQANLLSGDATTFTTCIYDFTTGKVLATSTNSFGSDLSYSMTCPSDAEASHDIKLIIYSGVQGNTSDNETEFNDVIIGYEADSINEGCNATFTSASDLRSQCDSRTIGDITFTAQWEALLTVVYHSNDATQILYKGNEITEEELISNHRSTFLYATRDENGLHDGDDVDGLYFYKTLSNGTEDEMTGYWTHAKTLLDEYKIHWNVSGTGYKLASLLGYPEWDGTYPLTLNVELEWVYGDLDLGPTIVTVDRIFTLDEAQSGEITEDELLRKVTVTDSDIGDYTDFSNGEGLIEIISYGASEYVEFQDDGYIEETVMAVDKAGNIATATVRAYIVETNGGATYGYYEPYTRFISDKYYKDAEGNFISEEFGGFPSASVWVNNPEYEAYLTKLLSNKQDAETGEWDNVYQSFYLDERDIMYLKVYTEKYGLGNQSGPYSNPNYNLRALYDNFLMYRCTKYPVGQSAPTVASPWVIPSLEELKEEYNQIS